MPQIVHAIDIDAPIQKVWEILMDTDRYTEWNPLIRGIDGRLARGSRVTASFSAEGRTLNIKVDVTQCDGQKLVWVGPPQRLLHKLARGEHYFELVELEGERTRLFHGERFTGLLFEIPWKHIEKVVDPGYKAFNEALKAHAEAA